MTSLHRKTLGVGIIVAPTVLIQYMFFIWFDFTKNHLSYELVFVLQFTFGTIVKIYRLLTRGGGHNLATKYTFKEMHLEISTSLTKWERVNVTDRLVSDILCLKYQLLLFD